MPGGVPDNRAQIIRGTGRSLSEEELDRAVENVLRLVAKHRDLPSGSAENAPDASGRTDVPDQPADIEELLLAHMETAVDLAVRSAVLLKNDGTLPLSAGASLIVVGGMFERMRYQGAGSSGLNPKYIMTHKDAFDRAGVHYTYARGYDPEGGTPSPALEEEALKAAEHADTVLVYCGLTDMIECEGYDRSSFKIPENQISLITKLCELGKKVVLILSGGAAFDLEFAENANAVLHMFLPGQGGGEAARRLLFGECCPSGHLSET